MLMWKGGEGGSEGIQSRLNDISVRWNMRGKRGFNRNRLALSGIQHASMQS